MDEVLLSPFQRLVSDAALANAHALRQPLAELIAVVENDNSFNIMNSVLPLSAVDKDLFGHVITFPFHGNRLL